MGKVVLDKTMSLDGFIARPDDDVTRLFAWYGGQPTIALKELGEGICLFDHLGTQPIELETTRVIESPGVTHLRFRLVK